MRCSKNCGAMNLREKRRQEEREAYERENPVKAFRLPKEWADWLESEAERRGVKDAVLLREATMLLRRAYGGLPDNAELAREPTRQRVDVSPHDVAQSSER